MNESKSLISFYHYWLTHNFMIPETNSFRSHSHSHSQRLAETTNSNPCPICHKTNGNCRSSQDQKLILCMTHFANDFERIGYKYIGETKDRNWGKFISITDNDYSQEKKFAYQKYQESLQKAKEERLKDSLSDEERDRNIRIISKHLGLTSGDKEKLLNRGLNEEQIIKGNFFSIRPFSKIPDSVTVNLAGVFIDRDGDKAIGSDYSQGIACITFNRNGLITGYQIRRDVKNNKYIWAKTGKKLDRQEITSHLKNGELPITYHGTGKQDTLHLVEGILKPYITHCRLGIDVLGASGGNFIASKKQSLEIIKTYKKIVLVPDAGDCLNKQVIKRLTRQVQWLEENKIEVSIAWFDQVHKDDNDIDEIEEFKPKLITFEKFLEIAYYSQLLIKKALTLNGLSQFNTNVKIAEKFIKDDLDTIIFDNKILAIKSPKNSGKTFWVNEKIKATDKPVIWIGHRRILVYRSCLESEIIYIDNSIIAEDIELEPVTYQKIGLVIDSVLKLKDINWQDAIIVIDEAEQFIEALLLASTHIKTVRSKVLALLAEKLPQVNSIILMDADLSDFTVDFFKDLSHKETIKVENTYQENNRTLRVFFDRHNLLGLVELAIEKDQPIMIVSDSAKTLKAMHKEFTEKGIKSKLLTRDELSDHPENHKYFQNKGKAIRDEKIQVVFASPVIQSGVSLEIESLEIESNENNQLLTTSSIDDEVSGMIYNLAESSYFKGVFGLFYGVVLPSIARQMLLRDRGNAPRFVWTMKRGRCPNQFDFEQIMKNELFRNESLLDQIEYLKYIENLGEGEAIIKAGEIIRDSGGIKNVFSMARAKLIAKRNLLLSDYQENFIKESKQEGYEIIIEDYCPISSNIDLKALKNQIDDEQSIRVYNAQKITEGQAKILEKKDNIKEFERDQLFKYQLMVSLPKFELSPEFILFMIQDRYATYTAVKNYYLAQHPEVAKKLDTKATNHQLSLALESGIFWHHDIKQTSTFVNLYKDLNLDDIFNKEQSEKEIFREFLKEFKNKCYRQRRKLSLLGINFSKKTKDLVLFKMVIALFGFSTERIRHDKQDTFIIIKKSVWFDDIYSSLKVKYSEEIEVKSPLKTAESKNGLKTISNNIPSHVNASNLLNKDTSINVPLNQDTTMDRGAKKILPQNEGKNKDLGHHSDLENNIFLHKIFEFLPPIEKYFTPIKAKFWHPQQMSQVFGEVVAKFSEGYHILFGDRIIPCGFNQVDFVNS